MLIKKPKDRPDIVKVLQSQILKQYVNQFIDYGSEIQRQIKGAPTKKYGICKLISDWGI